MDWQMLSLGTDYLLLDVLALTLLVVSAVTAVQMRDLLGSAVMLGTFSLLMGLIYLLLDAPDVALTEAAVGAGISTILFLGSLIFIGRTEKPRSAESRILPVMVVVVVGAALVFATYDLPQFASPDAPAQQHVSPYYIQHMASDINIPNLVTAILASYRGFDTMGEVAVIFTAGIAICMLLMNNPAPLSQSEELDAPGTPVAEQEPLEATAKKKPSIVQKKSKPKKGGKA